MKKVPVTQQEIAIKLRVSRITVSKALRDHPDISEAMREKVRMAADEMGYTPNMVAANLSKRKTNTIGVVVPDLENSFFAYLTDSIIDKATENDYRIILTVSREKDEIETRNILNLMGMRVDGLLVCISQTTSGSGIFGYAHKLGIPLVFFDRAIKANGFSHVSFNDRQGTEEAIKKLSGQGYTKFAHFAGYRKISIGRERCNAFKSSLRKRDIEIRQEWIIEGGFEIEDGYRAFRKLLSAGKMPDLILAVNDRVALGAYRAAMEAGMKIPDDIAVTGFGFAETASLFNPSLAVINQDPRKLGAEALRVLLDEIEGDPKAPVRVRIDEQFVPGDSIRYSV